MKIGFCGTMSVGKTTLVNALKELPEFKDYTFATERSKYLRDLGIPLNTDSTIKGQMVFLAERASELMCEKIVTDRTVIDVMAFTRAAKSIPYMISDQFEILALNLVKEYDYVFYVSPEGVEIEDNGVRTIDPEYRMEIDKNIQRLLDKYPHKFKRLHRISGTTEERIQQIKQVINFQYL
jgi:nicotinamide riboside kinase